MSYNRLDFLQFNDGISKAYTILGGFPCPHLGLKLSDHYLIAPERSKGPTRWVQYGRIASRYQPHIVHSFSLERDDWDPCLVTMIPEGVLMDSPSRLAWTEIAHWGADAGLWKYRPQRNACVGLVSTMLQYMGYPITATSSQYLFNQLSDLSNIDGSGVCKHDQ